MYILFKTFDDIFMLNLFTQVINYYLNTKASLRCRSLAAKRAVSRIRNVEPAGAL